VIDTLVPAGPPITVLRDGISFPAILVPLTAVIISPAFSPAFSAGEPGIGAVIMIA